MREPGHYGTFAAEPGGWLEVLYPGEEATVVAWEKTPTGHCPKAWEVRPAPGLHARLSRVIFRVADWFERRGLKRRNGEPRIEVR